VSFRAPNINQNGGKAAVKNILLYAATTNNMRAHHLLLKMVYIHDENSPSYVLIIGIYQKQPSLSKIAGINYKACLIRSKSLLLSKS
jgi:hypothetical protein